MAEQATRKTFAQSTADALRRMSGTREAYAYWAPQEIGTGVYVALDNGQEFRLSVTEVVYRSLTDAQLDDLESSGRNLRGE